jgi:dipeptidase E
MNSDSILIDEAFIEVPLEPEMVSKPLEPRVVSELTAQEPLTDEIAASDDDLIPVELEDAPIQPTVAIHVTPPEPPEIIQVVSSIQEPELVSSIQEPEVVSSFVEPEVVSNFIEPEVVSSIQEPELVSSIQEPEILSSFTEPEIVSGVQKPEIVSDFAKPEIILSPQIDAVISSIQEPEIAPSDEPASEPEIASGQINQIVVDLGDAQENPDVGLADAGDVVSPPLLPESDLISSVAEFEAISSVAEAKHTPEILLALTEQPSTPTLKTASWDMVTAASVTKRQIIALGGGGFSQEPENLLLDQYILEHARSARDVSVPRVCFVSTAAGDAPSYIERFYTAFKNLECEPYHLPLFHPEDWADELEDMILGADVLYFSGGSTKNALALWKAWELEPVFQQAYEAGTVFTGISAGAICWFEQFTTDSIGRSLGAMEGLGWLPGSFTPHYDSERYRKTMLERLLRARKISPGFAADDGVAIHFINSEYAGAVSSRQDAKAYHVTLGRNRLVESPLETVYLGHNS